ncbi:MAG: putative peptidase [Myxococcaceae bacterium]|nr:putative peptidase [Myxococcaceae bacterium]
MLRSRIGLVLLIVASASCSRAERPSSKGRLAAATTSSSEASSSAPFVTQLVRKGPAPQPWRPLTPPANVAEVRIPSEGRRLLAWFAYPPSSKAAALPVLVYLHGGFAFDSDDFDVARPFLQSGFAVLTPTSRGENGNDGAFELMLGEVDDALAAVAWVAEQPRIDKSRIYVFGHSSGGALSALLSLRGDARVRASGSAAGLYPAAQFEEWQAEGIVPFDPTSARECEARVVLPRVDRIKTRHIAYVATEEGWTPARARQAMAPAVEASAPFSVVVMPGSHGGILTSALDQFRRAVAD